MHLVVRGSYFSFFHHGFRVLPALRSQHEDAVQLTGSKDSKAVGRRYLVQKWTVVAVAAATLEKVLTNFLVVSLGAMLVVCFLVISGGVLLPRQRNCGILQGGHPNELHHLSKHVGLVCLSSVSLAVAERAVLFAAGAPLPKRALDRVCFAGFAVAEGTAIALT